MEGTKLSIYTDQALYMRRYVIFMEGTEEWADRLKLLLQLGSVVLMQELWCNEHYAWMLEPWVHYVPVRADLEDLMEKLEWAESHPQEAQQISENATELMRKLSSSENFEPLFQQYC